MYNAKKKERLLVDPDVNKWLSELDDDISLHDCGLSQRGFDQAKVSVF